jgi:glycosyltransferase involved in cell wall biosynthesis
MRATVSVLVLTRDEQANLAACLESLSFSDDIVVLDSGSTDRTVAIARSFPNVRVIERPFDTEHAQRNFGLHDIRYQYEWLYVCDADERVPDDLIVEIAQKVADRRSPHVAYRLRYRNMFMGRWIRHATGYPVWLIRLMKPQRVFYEQRATNVHPVVHGSVGSLRAHFVHHGFASGLTRWLAKHNRYSELESIEAARVRQEGWGSWRDLLHRDPMHRRRALKNLSFRLRGRGLCRFLYQYLLRRGLLDGRPGLLYCAMIAMYESWIELKVRQGQSNWSEQTRALAQAQMPQDEPTVVDQRASIVTLIPACNESRHIADAVTSALPLGPVVVLDSGSTDDTRHRARQAGATVVEHAWEGYAAQKNWGLEHLPVSGDWVLILDADERVTPALVSELHRVGCDAKSADGWFLSRRLFIFGREVRHGGLYPSWNLRFFRRGTCRYEDRAVHEHMLCDGRTAKLRQPLLHVRDETLGQFIDKHIRYAELEAQQWERDAASPRGAGEAAKFPRMMRWRQWLRRRVWPRVPMRPLWRWLYMIGLRCGWRDGSTGFLMAALMAHYELMITAFVAQRRHEARSSTTRRYDDGVSRGDLT